MIRIFFILCTIFNVCASNFIVQEKLVEINGKLVIQFTRDRSGMIFSGFVTFLIDRQSPSLRFINSELKYIDTYQALEWCRQHMSNAPDAIGYIFPMTGKIMIPYIGNDVTTAGSVIECSKTEPMIIGDFIYRKDCKK